ncbi:MAG: GNAT family N-acetyltransferase [Planctomycetales bacterium]|nr:GNAT family N-acetyltransferase [Planctomycetales bacterium]
MPFRAWEWLAIWWKHYAALPNNDLYVLAVYDDTQRIVGIVPWYRELRPSEGRILSFLGSGKACTDYATVLCQPENQARVAEALAEWLVRANDEKTDATPDQWDLIELEGVAAADAAVTGMCAALESRGLTVHRRTGVPCFRIDIRNGLEGYLQELSKGGRRRLRKALRDLDDPQFQVTHYTTAAAIAEHWPTFKWLHQQRRHELGESGCFEYPPMGEFLRDASCQLAATGQAELVVNWCEDKPIAAELIMFDSGSLYIYQSGLDPAYAEISPGRMGMAHCLREAIKRDVQYYDLLRGAEPYKLRWRAKPVETTDYRIVSRRAGAQLRHQVWVARHAVKDWLKSGLERTGLRK